MQKVALIWFCSSFFSLLFILVLFGLFNFKKKYTQENKNNKVLTIQIDSLKEEIKISKIKKNQLALMEKTMHIAFPTLITKYEIPIYCKIYLEFSEKFNIPWQIFPALMWYENRFRHGKISDKGAKGSCQLLESTFKELCKKNKIKYEQNVTIHNNIINIFMGLTYLSEGIQKQGLDYGIKRYVAGPNFKKKNKKKKKYILQYHKDVKQKFKKLVFISKGIKYDNFQIIKIIKRILEK